MALPLSVQLYSVRDLISGDRDAVLRSLAAAGYGAVEPFQPTLDPGGFRAVADDLGLTVSSVHAGDLLGDNPGAVFDAAATLGTDLAIVPAGIPHDEFATPDGLGRTADILNALAERADTFGQRVGYHNHWWEFAPQADGRHAIEALADLLDPRVFLEVDTYWAAVAGADVVALLGRLGGRVHALHVKDGPVVEGEPHTAVGQGAMPVPEILAAAPEDAWRVVELDECATDMMTALIDSRSYLSALEDA
jgi:sugar phosphate isomerase/epimerase